MTAEVLIDRIWEEEPPGKAPATLSAYISRLSTSLAEVTGGSTRVEQRADGYVLHVGTDDVDLGRFRTLRRQARAISGSGGAEQAVALLREGEALWRGEPLGGLPGRWFAAMRVSLQDEHRAAIVERVQLELDLGRHGDVVGELRQLCARYPLDETLIACQMIALYRCGRAADALAVYQEAHSRLYGEMSLMPGPALRELQQQILRRDPQLAITPAYRRPGRASQPSTLPPDTAQLTGRDDETRLLTGDDGHADPPPVKIIHGMAGVGKTALAVHVAHELAGRHPDAQLYLNFRAHNPGHTPLSPAGALHRLLQMLDIPAGRIPRDTAGRADLWARELTHRRAVIVLDDVPGLKQIRSLLPPAAGCVFLITTRRRPSAAENAQILALDVLPAGEAITLFRRTACLGGDRDENAISDIVRLCGHLPLAIQLVAAKAGQDPSAALGSLAEELSQPGAWLSQAGGEDSPVTSAFGCSYRALTSSQQRFFRLLGIHPCSEITLYGAAALTATSLTTAKAAVDALLDHHLLEPAAPGYFRFHDLIRSYSSSLTAGSDREQRQAIARLLAYYLSAADRCDRILYPHRRRIPVHAESPPAAEPEIANAEDARAWLELEWRNIIQAARYAAVHEWKQHCAELAHVLAEFLNTTGRWSYAIDIHTAALQARHDLGDRPGAARAAIELSNASVQTGHLDDALSYAEQATATYRSLADQRGEADALDLIGTIHDYTAHFHEGLAHFQEARLLYRDVGDRRGMAETTGHAGLAQFFLGRYSESINCFHEALHLYRQAGDRRGEAKILNNIGDIQRRRGYHRDAVANYQNSFSIFLEVGGEQSRATLHNNMGSIHRYKGKYEDALAEYRKALAIYRVTDDLRGQAGVLNDIGSAYQAMEQHSEALIHHHQAQLIAEKIGELYEHAVALRGVADAQCGTGDHAGALGHYQEALRLARQIGEPYEEGAILNGIAETILRTRGPQAARIYWRQALDIFQRLDVPEAGSVRIRLDALRVDAS